MFYDGHYFAYEAGLEESKNLINFINRLLHPVVNLKTQAEVELFLQNDKEWIETSKFLVPYAN